MQPESKTYTLYLQTWKADKFVIEKNRFRLKPDFQGKLKLSTKVTDSTIVVTSVTIWHGFDVVGSDEFQEDVYQERLKIDWCGVDITTTEIERWLIHENGAVNHQLLEGDECADFDIVNVKNAQGTSYCVEFTRKPKRKDWKISQAYEW